MRSLDTLSNTIVSALQAASLCANVHIVETRSFSDTQFRLKYRADVVDRGTLQVYVYVNDDHIDYSYQFMRAQISVLRWDNKEHFPNLASYPHHFHNYNGSVEESSLTGDPETDLRMVLDYLATQYSPPE